MWLLCLILFWVTFPLIATLGMRIKCQLYSHNESCKILHFETLPRSYRAFEAISAPTGRRAGLEVKGEKQGDVPAILRFSRCLFLRISTTTKGGFLIFKAELSLLLEEHADRV